MTTHLSIDIDSLANEIRRVDGNHELGAGALAERIATFINSAAAAHYASAIADAANLDRKAHV